MQTDDVSVTTSLYYLQDDYYEFYSLLGRDAV